jgi:hypothetical protein
VAKQLEPWIVQQVQDILPRSSEEVVDTEDVVFLRQQPLAQMRSQESGAACD